MNRIVHWVNINDSRIFSFFHLKLRCKFWDICFPIITHLGGAVFTLSLLLCLIIFFSGTTQKWAIEALLSLIISHIIVQVIKKSIPRSRPYITLPNIRMITNPLKDYSFPSGHTTACFSLTVTFALHSFILAVLLIPVACLVGISRIYLGLHYPTDCLMGALLGTITSVLVVYLNM